MRLWCISALLLLPAATLAQRSETRLPEAPSAVLAESSRGDAAVSGELTLEAPEYVAGPDVGWWSREPESEEPETGDAGGGMRLDVGALLGKMNRSDTSSTAVVRGPNGVQVQREGYHWKGLLWESFAFFGVENTQRLVADSYFRALTVGKPFWHDYEASLKQWNWGRWSDGDSFLVAYIGHPLQGSITEYIEIQNNPRTRALRINDGKPYWKSRLQSVMWATAFSTDQKLGPLGETALGSEGAYNYVVGCSYFCSAYFANPSHYKVTNNTGWVKLVSTPVVGTVWTVMEDAIDHLISDRVQGDRTHALFPKILRGALNPSRTAANMLRWRTPWYRDWQAHDPGEGYVWRTPKFLPGDDVVILAAPRYEVFPHLTWISLPVNTESCAGCRQKIAGYGVELSWRVATYADVDADVNYLPDASPLPSDRAGGSIVTATFGLRSGFTAQHFALKAFLRPGFLSYARAYVVSPSADLPVPPVGRITHFSAALGVEGSVYVNRHLGLRAVVANQPVRYRLAVRDPPGTGTYPYLNWLSKLNFLTNENWTYQMGTVLRF